MLMLMIAGCCQRYSFVEMPILPLHLLAFRKWHSVRLGLAWFRLAWIESMSRQASCSRHTPWQPAGSHTLVMQVHRDLEYVHVHKRPAGHATSITIENQTSSHRTIRARVFTQLPPVALLCAIHYHALIRHGLCNYNECHYRCCWTIVTP